MSGGFEDSFVSSEDGIVSLSFFDEEASVAEDLAGLRYASRVLLDILCLVSLLN